MHAPPWLRQPAGLPLPMPASPHAREPSCRTGCRPGVAAAARRRGPPTLLRMRLCRFSTDSRRVITAARTLIWRTRPAGGGGAPTNEAQVRRPHSGAVGGAFVGGPPPRLTAAWEDCCGLHGQAALGAQPAKLRHPQLHRLHGCCGAPQRWLGLLQHAGLGKGMVGPAHQLVPLLPCCGGPWQGRGVARAFFCRWMPSIAVDASSTIGVPRVVKGGREGGPCTGQAR